MKLIRVFVGIKKVYCADCQHLLSNAKNTHFLSPNGNVPSNIGCMHGQNSFFVEIFTVSGRAMERWIKPESVIRTHMFRFVITAMLPYCFSPLAGICAAITSRRSPLRLR
ncbi:MAG: hypothetical protein ACTTIF_00070 [Prevotella sp.]